MNSSDDETLVNESGDDGMSAGVSISGQIRAGVRLGDYEIERLLGVGAMGEVYLARQVRLDQKCALKVLPPELTRSADFEKRFAQEGRSLAKLDHPHIVRVYNAGEADGLHFLAMEYVGGGTLEDRLEKSGGSLPESETGKLLGEMLAALSYAHGQNVIHRDLKPANILLTESGFCKIGDFGLALVAGEEYVQSMIRESVVRSQLAGHGRAKNFGPAEDPEATIPADEARAGLRGKTSVETKTPLDIPDPEETILAKDTRLGGALPGNPEETLLESEARRFTRRPSRSSDAGAFVGTLDYMSPEIRDGRGAADARSDLFAIGVMAYQMLTGQKPRGFVKAPSRLVKGISSRWDAWVMHCMEVDPNERFQSAEEALRALGKVMKTRSRLMPVCAAAAIVAAVIGGVFWSVQPSRSVAPKTESLAASTDKTPVATLAVPEPSAAKSADSPVTDAAKASPDVPSVSTSAPLTTAPLPVAGPVKSPPLTVAAAPKGTDSPPQDASKTGPAPEPPAPVSAKTPSSPAIEPGRSAPAPVDSTFARVDSPTAETAISGPVTTPPASPTEARPDPKPAKPEPPKPVIPGGLAVRTDPPGARVQVEGQASSVSPALFDNLAPKTYHLTISLDGYETVTDKVAVASGESATPPVYALVRQTGNLLISSTPPGSGWKIVSGPSAVRAADSGTTPATLEQLPTGDYELEFSRAGWKSSRVQVSVRKGENASVSEYYPQGSLRLDSNVIAVVRWIIRSYPVAVDAMNPQFELSGGAPATLEGMPAGGYTIEFHREGWPVQVRDVRVEANKAAELVCLYPNGKLTISTNCSDAVWRLVSAPDLTLVAKSSGTVPATLSGLPYGEYVVEISRKGWKPARVTVPVNDGQASVASYVFHGGDLALSSNVTDAKWTVVKCPDAYDSARSGDSARSVTLRDVPVGIYVIEFTRAGAKPLRTEANVAEFAKSEARGDFPLGRISLASNRPGARYEVVSSPVALDPGMQSGALPAALGNLPGGDYVVEFRFAGWPALRKSVRIGREDKAELRGDFNGGTIVLSSLPAGAEVVDVLGGNKVIGNTATPLVMSNLTPGRYAFVLRMPGYGDEKIGGNVEADGTLKLSATLKPLPKAAPVAPPAPVKQEPRRNGPLLPP